MTGPGTGGAEFALGTRRGLAACASARGTFAVLALDHRQNLRKELRPDDPASVTYDEMVEFKRAVVRALAPVATGTLLDPEIGAAQCIADGSLPATAGLLVAIEATGYLGPSTARVSRVLEGWSVEQAKRMGASAAKLLVYYHPEASNADAPGAVRRGGRPRPAGRRTSRSSWSRCRSRWSRASRWPARRGGGSSSRPRGG